MAHNGHRLRALIVSFAALVLLASPAVADDQNQSASASAQSAPSSPPDFMLGRPRVMVGVRGSWFKANAASDIYDFITDEFTVDKSDFNSGSFTAEMSVNVASRLDITGGIDFNGMSKPSEDRDEEELGNDVRLAERTSPQTKGAGLRGMFGHGGFECIYRTLRVRVLGQAAE